MPLSTHTRCLLSVAVTLDCWLPWEEPAVCNCQLSLISPQGSHLSSTTRVEPGTSTPGQKYTPQLSLWPVRKGHCQLFQPTKSCDEFAVWEISQVQCDWPLTIIQGLHKTTFIDGIEHLQVQIDMQKIYHCIASTDRLWLLWLIVPSHKDLISYAFVRACTVCNLSVSWPVIERKLLQPSAVALQSPETAGITLLSYFNVYGSRTLRACECRGAVAYGYVWFL